MIPLIRSVSSPLWSIVLLTMSGGFFITFISLRLKAEGASAYDVSWVQSSYYAGLLLGAARVERLIRRVGHIRAFAAFASVHTATILLQGLLGEPYLWIVTRFVAGFCIAGLYVVIESWLLAKSTLVTRGQVLAIYMVGLYASQALAQYFLDIVRVDSFDAFFLAGMLGSLSAVPLCLTYHASPSLHQPSTHGIFDLCRLAPFGFLGCVISGVVLSSLYSFAPLFADQAQASVSHVMFLLICGGFLLQWPLGKLSDLMDRRRVLLGVTMAGVLPAMGLAFSLDHIPAILVLSFVMGGFAFCLYPLSITQVCDRVSAEDITAVTGLLLFAYGLGAVIGPLPVPIFLGLFPANGLWIYISLVLVLMVVGGLISLATRKQVPMDEQMDFVPLPSVTPVAYELDPRMPEALVHEELRTPDAAYSAAEGDAKSVDA